MSKGPRGLRRPSMAVLALAIFLVLSLTASSCEDSEPRPAPTPTQSAKPTNLSFGVWGADEEIEAFQGLVDDYNAENDGTTIRLMSWPTHDAFIAAVNGGRGATPDLYMVSRGDLTALSRDGLNQPLLELLDERGVDYSDDYSRDALLAFSADNELQCMPYGISPMVIYYNSDLIDFERMRELELPAPEDDEHESWTFEQFTAAAEFATRPRRGTRGVYIEPTLRGLAPFIYSGGGELFNDDEAPTSLALSTDDSRDALTRTLELLRNAPITLTEEQLAQATALEWFKRGKLGMIAGFRDITPELREVDGLDFDVMPMPKLDDAATIGDITGLCLSPDAESIAKAADFLVHMVSDESVSRVARAGYLAPASLPVSVSEAFLQSTLEPSHAGVFTSSIRAMEIPPLVENFTELEAAVAASLRLLLNITVPDIEALTAQIDEESRTVLDPELTSPSPSESSTD